MEEFGLTSKSLKDRVGCEVNCTTKKEWSEEDEKMLNSFLHKLEVCDLLSNKEITWIKDKLKSLEERYRWKPSDEQMEAIKDAIEFLGCTKKVREDLKSLYGQLKKIRDE